MKLLWNDKDGGPESKGWIWGIESKRFGSVLLLRFRKGSRDAFHTHAFNSTSWLLSGRLVEQFYSQSGSDTTEHVPSLRPIRTWRDTFHKVYGMHDSNWAITFRGPWVSRWREYIPSRGHIALTHGRKEIA